MMQGVTRRLDRLEASIGTSNGLDVAAIIEAGRMRVRFMSPEELQQERKGRLADMQERHAVKPLRGLERRMMEGLERVCALDAIRAPASSLQFGAVP